MHLKITFQTLNPMIKCSKRVEIANLQLSTWNFFECHFYTQTNVLSTPSGISGDIAAKWRSLAHRAQIGQGLVVFPRPKGADLSGAGFSAPRGRRSVWRWWFFRAHRAQIGLALVVFPRPECADSIRWWWFLRAKRAHIGLALVMFPRP